MVRAGLWSVSGVHFTRSDVYDDITFSTVRIFLHGAINRVHNARNYTIGLFLCRLLKPEFHLARHVTTRHDSISSTCRASRDERVEPCSCSKMADGEQAIALACSSLIVFMLLHTQILLLRQIK